MDTHIWLWLVDDPDRVGRRTMQELKSANNELWLSPISTWEILTLHQKGRIKLHGDITDRPSPPPNWLPSPMKWRSLAASSLSTWIPPIASCRPPH